MANWKPVPESLAPAADTVTRYPDSDRVRNSDGSRMPGPLEIEIDLEKNHMYKRKLITFSVTIEYMQVQLFSF